MGMSPRADHFLDPEDGTLYLDGELHDAHGVDLVGVDPDGSMWWGTERATWVLEDGATTVVRVSGWMGPVRWDGFFLGAAEAAVDYAEQRRVRVDHVEEK